MAFVKIDLSKTKEPEVAAEGEYEIRVVKVVDTETKKGDPMTVLTLRIEDGGPDLAPFNEYLTYPNGSEHDHMRSIQIKRVLTMFDIEFDPKVGFDSNDLMGQTAKCLVIQEEGQDGIIRNRLRLPRMKE